MNQFVFITDENDNFFLYKMDMYVVLGSFELWSAFTIRELSNKIWIFVFHVIFHKILSQYIIRRRDF